jgi:hypothetical protein
MIRTATFALVLALVASCGSAFNTSPAFHKPTTTTSTTLYRGLMTPEELDSLMGKSKTCEESECSTDDVDMLIGELLEQQKMLHNRVKELKDMVKTLEHLNETDDRSVDEVQATVRAIARIFQMGASASGNDYPSLSRPTGWSGEIGDGPTTAYDALEPKKSA